MKYVLTTPPPTTGTPSPSLTASGKGKPFKCGICVFSARDNCGLRRHNRAKHTLRVPGLDCTRFHSLILFSYSRIANFQFTFFSSHCRSWCHEAFSTVYEWQQHTRSCLWKCAECCKPPLKYSRDIDAHVAWHIAQRAKTTADQ